MEKYSVLCIDYDDKFRLAYWNGFGKKFDFKFAYSCKNGLDIYRKYVDEHKNSIDVLIMDIDVESVVSTIEELRKYEKKNDLTPSRIMLTGNHTYEHVVEDMEHLSEYGIEQYIYKSFEIGGLQKFVDTLTKRIQGKK